MATVLKNLSDYDITKFNNVENYTVGIVVAEWNAEITNALLDGAKETLLKHGIIEDNILVEFVPGSFELTQGAQILLNSDDYDFDAIICLGCVIQGETRHFDFICDAVAHGLTNLSLEELKPVIFGVLTTNTMEQARERAGGKHGNKGVEAAVTALKMINLSYKHIG